MNIADIEAFDDLSRKVDKQEGLIETLKKMHDEDVERIKALENKFEGGDTSGLRDFTERGLFKFLIQ